ncbi:bacteriophage protein [Escherichia coli]|uniref:Bacteriophage protein n=1 Tax=Escherichia coli TaxID=562 RepID=A0A3S4L5M8_ECOLX|nr:bacteriophage protein [Escherichia coli]
MTQNYELIVKGIRNFENKVTVTLALRDKKNALTVKFLTWTSRWTVLKVPRWSFMRQQPEGASDRSSWMLLPGYVKGTSCCQKRAPVQRRGIP